MNEEQLQKEWKTYCCKMVVAGENPLGYRDWKEQREQAERPAEYDNEK